MNIRATPPHLIIGLTGGIGSGKSAATHFFSDFGIEVIDADVMARVVVERGKPALHSIEEHFGREILCADGSLDRSALRQRVFADHTERLWLEGLLHPLIRQEIERRLHSSRSLYAILSSPLLLDTGLDSLTDRVLVIDAPETLQIERTRLRDNTSSDAVATIIASQWNRNQRLARADDVILNDSKLEQLRDRVRAMHETYCAMCTANQSECKT